VIKVILTHDSIEYLVGEYVASSDSYRVYICNNGTKQYLLQIASDIEHNGGLDRAAYILKELKQISDLYETEYAKLHLDARLSYDRLFPNILDSFISDEQGDRRINILAFNDIDTIDKMVPLSNLFTKDKLRISLETSAWIMGRLLKLLSFIHEEKISIQLLSGNNVLIDLERHHTVLFDWSIAHSHQGRVPDNIRRDNISDAAKTVFTAIGGDIHTGAYSYDENHPYVRFLWKLACGEENDALKAHEQFYKLVHGIFGKGYIPSKILPL
jgi:serine/threonine protein kinase